MLRGRGSGRIPLWPGQDLLKWAKMVISGDKNLDFFPLRKNLDFFPLKKNLDFFPVKKNLVFLLKII